MRGEIEKMASPYSRHAGLSATALGMRGAEGYHRSVASKTAGETGDLRPIT